LRDEGVVIASIAIDQGTTSTKAFGRDPHGRMVELGRHEHAQFHPRPGWVEHDPLELLDAVRRFAALAEKETTVGLANQGETVVAWDARTKQPLHRAIVWQDKRTLTAVEALRAEGVEALTLSRAGLPLDPYFSASKLRWLLDNAEGAHALAAAGHLRLGTSDAFFLDSLTGVFATDVATASRTSLLNLRTLGWDADLCAAFGVPIECLPVIRSTVDDFGAVASSGARVMVGIVDQQAALFGHGCRRPGDIKITFGTGAFALGLTGAAPRMSVDDGLVPTCGWRLGTGEAAYALDGGLLTAGAAVDWLRATLGGSLADETPGVDRRVAPGGLMFVPAQAGLGSPHWDASARGLWIGLDLATSRADLCRAVYEGIALRAAEVITAMRRAGGVERISIDGGLSRSAYFQQLLADAIGTTIHVSSVADMTAKGVLDLCDHAAGRGEAEPVAWRVVQPASPFTAEVHARFADAVQRARSWAA
jgi:glycerol kinase